MIQCESLSKSYGKKSIIRDTSIAINSNEITFLMGENGAGKTTFLKCLMGMENYRGRVIFDGNSIDNVRDECLVLWDDCPFYPNLSGLQNLLVFNEHNKPKERIIASATRFLDRTLLNAKVKTYSYGQKKRLALALVDLLEPKYLFMDEISNGLDYELLKDLHKIIKNWAESMTIVLTGHQLGFYNDLIDSLILMRNGQMSIYTDKESGEGFDLEGVYDREIH